MATISAGQLFQTAEVEALNQIFRLAQGPTTSSYYLALCGNATSGSLDDTFLTMASVTEFGATGYSRQVMGPTAPTAASPSVIKNTATVTWGPLTGSITGTPINWVLGTDATGAGSGTTAKLMCAFLVTTPRTPLSGDSVAAAANALTCTL